MEIAEALKEQHGIDIDRRKLSIADPINDFGAYSVDVKLYPEISGKINVIVTAK